MKVLFNLWYMIFGRVYIYRAYKEIMSNEDNVKVAKNMGDFIHRSDDDGYSTFLEYSSYMMEVVEEYLTLHRLPLVLGFAIMNRIDVYARKHNNEQRELGLYKGEEKKHEEVV